MTISAVKPAAVPRWASLSPGTSRLDPSSGQKDTGWTNTQRPPFNVMNWLQGVQYDWQQYLEQATDQLESSKINKTGATDLSGTFRPTADKGATLGIAAQRLASVATAGLSLGASTVASVTTSNVDLAIGANSFMEITGVAAGRSIRSLTGGADGQIVVIWNTVSGAGASLTLVRTAIASGIADRLSLVGNVDAVLAQNERMVLMRMRNTTTGISFWQELFRSTSL